MSSPTRQEVQTWVSYPNQVTRGSYGRHKSRGKLDRRWGHWDKASPWTWARGPMDIESPGTQGDGQSRRARQSPLSLDMGWPICFLSCWGTLQSWTSQFQILVTARGARLRRTSFSLHPKVPNLSSSSEFLRNSPDGLNSKWSESDYPGLTPKKIDFKQVS